MDTAAATPPGTTAEGATAATLDHEQAGTRQPAARHPRLDPYWLAAGFFVAFAAVSVCRYRRMATMSWDLGIFEQAIRSYAHFQTPVADLKGPGFNILGDHFSPVTALLAPFYRVFPSPVTLLVAQAALFALSTIPVTRVAARLLGRGRGLAIGVAYGLSWGVQRAVDFDFHEIAFAMPLLALSLEAVILRRWYAAMLWAAPLVFVKEDMGATVAAIGAVILIRTWQERPPRIVPLAVGLIAFGVLACALALGVIIPSFNGSGSYDYWNKVGSGGEQTGTIPFETAVRTLLWVLLPTSGLLALRSPLLLAAVPTLGWRFVSHDDHYWGTDWHYSAVLMPIVALALVDAVHRTRDSHRPWLASYARQLPALVAGAALALTASLPLENLTDPGYYEKPKEVTAVERLLDRIPDGASVEANVGPISRLTNRCRVLWVGGTRGVVPDYIALQEYDRTPDQLVEYAKQLHPDARYAYLGSSGGYFVLKRVHGG
ncbi:DUF2079 domain-containing protein [Streptomyces sparsogenes]|uniref:Putative integral membrane protein n=1 Tax=Streptomyces sparsogenes DSM 40356 TaxID=1331668 RepID=A0A1R1S606_9ACTN|nr:DUF2079 domain-containing protein [Streptomyces sparsogenes]OMI33529.1 putative integral membrane protein [Streptomyces sparsogenes DSM 40356]